MPWAISEATMASAVVLLSIRSALVFGFAADVQIRLALSRGGVFPFRVRSANTPTQISGLSCPAKAGHPVPPAVAIASDDFRLRIRWLLDRPLSRTMTPRHAI